MAAAFVCGSRAVIAPRSAGVSQRGFCAQVQKSGLRTAAAARRAIVMGAEVGKGNGDLEKVTLVHEPSGQQVEAYAMGATVTSWKARGGEEMFFTSKVASWDGSKPIRAGIPICWPQFGPFGDLPTHGFARNVMWTIKSTSTESDGSVCAVFGLDSNHASDLVKAWPSSFTADYRVILSKEGLETTLYVKNTGSESLKFTFSLHNYFSVSDVASTKVFGLEKLTYMDRMNDSSVQDEPDDFGAGMGFDKETDRIYYGAPEELAILDVSTLKLIKIKKTPTLNDATVWTPFGSEGCDPGWKSFLCVEPAAVQNPVTLAPGEEWVGGQLLGVE